MDLTYNWNMTGFIEYLRSRRRMASKLLVVQGSIALNCVLMLYLCISWYSYDAKSNNVYRMIDVPSTEIAKDPVLPPVPENFKDDTVVHQEGFLRNLKDTPVEPEEIVMANPTNSIQEPPREVQESVGVPASPIVMSPIVEEIPDPPIDSLERKMYGDLKDCVTHPLKSTTEQRGSYWVLKNYIPAVMSFRCDESITYTTHGDYTFLDNLDPLTSRWQGPVSVAVYAPGEDLNPTIESILYIRNCMAEGIKKYVTFHIFFDNQHVPAKIPTSEELLQRKIPCDKDPPKWTDITTFKQKKKLLYPVNVARNIAKEYVQTYFVMPSDVELYPSINFIPDFFQMLKKPDVSNTTNERVYVFPIFEVDESQTVPETKAELQAMLADGKAIPFHKRICNQCHKLPKGKEWIEEPAKPGLSVYSIGKRLGEFHTWEPIYLGTAREPMYEERLSWEGKSDKMTQMYILCVRDYEFHILDTAFLVHRPGIKKPKKEQTRNQIVAKQNKLIRAKITPEYHALFGRRKGCNVW